MIEAIKVIALLCGVVCILMNFPFIILAVALLALLCFFVWGLTFFLIGGKNESFCKYSFGNIGHGTTFYNWCISSVASCNYCSYNYWRRFGGDYLSNSFLEVNYAGCFGLVMAGCGVAMIISLIVLLALLIKSFKEEW